MKRKSKKALGWFSLSVLFINYIIAALTLFSYLASITDPVKFWPIAFLGLAYPVLLPLNLAVIAYWLFVRPGFALISVVTLLIGWNVLTGTIGFRLSEKSGYEKPLDAIRILTYNVHYFKKFDDESNSILTKEFMLSVIEKEKPDIICLQEMMTRRSGDFDNLGSLKKLTGLKYVYFEPGVDNSWEAQGLAILSRFPIVNKQSILFANSSRGNEAMAADLLVNGENIRVYNVHFQSIGFQPEDYKYLEEVKGIKTDDIQASRRIGSRLKRAFLLRSTQVKELKAHTAACQTPFLLAGDFNDTPGSYALNTMARGLKNTFREKGSGLGITYNGDFPNFQIDYILTSPQFTVKSYRIDDKKLSDHYAVRSDVALYSHP